MTVPLRLNTQRRPRRWRVALVVAIGGLVLAWVGVQMYVTAVVID
ncbi:hypothetical protein [Aquabacterium sp.]|nr:hypothetical protein [Aquabacterium sp.]HSW08022.1 hypothetical protein [Aquabacterium sp.]